MKLASYKAFGNPKATWLDKAIAICTLGDYSHTELVFSNGESLSISGRNNEGVRLKKIDFHPDRWDILYLNLSIEEEKSIYSRGAKYLHHRYDYIGALSSALRLCLQEERKMFCSELASTLLQPYYDLDRGCKYSPSRLHKELSNVSSINNRVS